MILLLGSLVFVAGYLIYLFATRKRLRVPVKMPATQSPYEVLFQRFVVLGAIAAILIGLSYYTGRPSFCANCHTKRVEVKALAKSSHKGIGCLKCHQSPGVSGAVLQKIDYSRWLWVYAVTNTVEPQRANVDDGACLRCHPEIPKKTVVRYGIKAKHRDFLEKGSHCVDCHNSVAHPEVVKPERRPSMDSCMKCHDDRVAKADCSVCHTKDIGSEIKEPRRGVMKVGVQPELYFCYRCHEEKKCTSCHGVIMPHPPDWLSHGPVAKHAKPAFTNREVCWRCHDIPEAPLKPAMIQACGCHGTMGYHGPQESWRKTHGPIATGKVPGDGENDYCGNCHSDNLCNHCHSEGKYKVPKQPSQN